MGTKIRKGYADVKEIFTKIYKDNFWRDASSVSGQGSNLAATELLCENLADFFTLCGVTSILDIPCGDFFWLSHMQDFEKFDYIGADIVSELVYQNKQNFPGIDFRILDATKDRLPQVDLIFCRDMLGHFSNRDVQRALKNFRASGSKYLLATTFPGRENIGDIQTGEWRPINLARMFGLPDPIGMINEGYRGAGDKFIDKSLGLWELRDDD